MKDDVFYTLKRASVKKVREIFRWANECGLRTYVDMLDVRKGWSRVNADKTLEEVLGLVDKEAIPYFRNAH